jgi:DNA transformation protein
MAGGFKEFLEELFAPMGDTTIRRMFGGHGVFRDGLMFGILSDDVLYFRVDEITQKRFEAEGSQPFTYEGKGRSVRLPYWRVPDWLFDETDAFLEWAQQSFGAARRVQEAKAPKRAARGKAKPAKKAKIAAKAAAKKKPARAAKAAKAVKPARKKPAPKKKTQKIRKKSAARA